MDARRLPAFIEMVPPANSAFRLTGSTNIVDAVTGLGDEIAHVSKFGGWKWLNPAGAMDNILGGTSGSYNANIAEAMAGYGLNIRNHIKSYFPAADDLIPSGMEQVGNVIDMVIKPGREGIDEVMDRNAEAEASETQDTWRQQLAPTA